MKKLHLGCGNIKKKGYLNCDISKKVHPDIVLDLEKKLPFKENTIDEIIAEHVLEHVRNLPQLMSELWRICKKDAVLKITVPYFSYVGAFSDPTHVRFFTPFTFDYFTANQEYHHEVSNKKENFKIIKKKINFGIGRSKLLNLFLNPLINLNIPFYSRFFSWILPASEIKFELIVKK